MHIFTRSFLKYSIHRGKSRLDVWLAVRLYLYMYISKEHKGKIFLIVKSLLREFYVYFLPWMHDNSILKEKSWVLLSAKLFDSKPGEEFNVIFMSSLSEIQLKCIIHVVLFVSPIKCGIYVLPFLNTFKCSIHVVPFWTPVKMW
jgi:hypothetical protein